MKILDLYIIKKFLKTYFFAVLIIVSIIMVIDYTEKIDNFIDNKASVHAVLFDYYLNFIPYWANYISPLMVFIATVFFTANLAARTEIIAILSTGVSFTRFIRPYFIASSIVGILTFFMVGWIIPNANKTRIAFERKYVVGSYYYSDRDVHIKIGPQDYAYMESYDTGSQTGYRFSLDKIDGHELKMKLLADHITWDSTRKKWSIFDYRVRTFLPNGKQKLTYGTKIDTTLNLLPKDFESKYQIHETLTNSELEDTINQIRTRGADGIEIFLIEKYLRFANPFAVIILSVIGVIVSARKARGGVGFQIALGFMLAFLYILFFMMSKGIAQSGGMPPLLAVWLPNIVFTVIGFILYYTVPR
ncbi:MULTISPECIES: LptF/LptG family permease [Arcicella]|uniref:LptF/LptG family permease n=1 Tax=Arcicella aquatica TaxID=217141 RepID=A0ABU5QJ60_9BACT|nr:MULTISPECIES: LptF/LptG family permease [Arcicella]MDR6564715.1 lipopolysaccharide export system permease protein [Arcicella sp. BE51]MDR6814511.1 lipopolysaccharide export system permease protein [Arcicella sp. BE140]MDR6825901.1 lipopolysaccharide export system permease protein [Arcicella sp. BE139]MEA5257100.1 LptF/LptG family permease [Arcicella aquatica]